MCLHFNKTKLTFTMDRHGLFYHIPHRPARGTDRPRPGFPRSCAEARKPPSVARRSQQSARLLGCCGKDLWRGCRTEHHRGPSWSLPDSGGCPVHSLEHIVLGCHTACIRHCLYMRGAPSPRSTRLQSAHMTPISSCGLRLLISSHEQNLTWGKEGENSEPAAQGDIVRMDCCLTKMMALEEYGKEDPTLVRMMR